MKLTLGIITGISIAWAALAIWRPTIHWAMTHNQPVTPPDHQPTYWHTVNGVRTYGPWT